MTDITEEEIAESKKQAEQLKQARLKAVSDRAKIYKALEESPEFQQWKREIFDDEMAVLKEKILNCDVTSEAGKTEAVSLIGAYQQINKIMTSFAVWQSYGEQADEVIMPPKEEQFAKFSK